MNSQIHWLLTYCGSLSNFHNCEVNLNRFHFESPHLLEGLDLSSFSFFLFSLFLFSFFFLVGNGWVKAESYCVALAALEFTMYTRLSLNTKHMPPCLPHLCCFAVWGWLCCSPSRPCYCAHARLHMQCCPLAAILRAVWPCRALSEDYITPFPTKLQLSLK